MKQTTLAKKERPLLTYAISKLRPDVFSHPVWVRFSDKDKLVSPETIQNLFGEAEQLQRNHPSDACQVLLICAVYQHYSGQKLYALRTIQKAFDLAACNGLSREILWAVWGACAVCVQQGNYEQAAVHFGRLQAMLNEQREWMLADYIDVVRQFFLLSARDEPEKYSDSPENQKFGGLLTLTFDWLHQWGFSAQLEPCMSPDSQPDNEPSRGLITRSLSSAQRPRGPWHTLRLMFRGELRLHWTIDDSPRTERRSPFWQSILDSLRAHFYGQKTAVQIIDAEQQVANSSPAQKATGDFVSTSSPPEPEVELDSKPIKIKRLSRQATTVIPVSVQMLGRFGITIQEEALNLPASRSLSLLQYLMLNYQQSTHREVLMDVFWPDAKPETARNNLNVAMHGIRKALRPVIELPVILYKHGAYKLAPEIQIWLDVEEFERLVNAGQRLESQNQSAAVCEYEAAISIYQGDFLEENPYEGWTVLSRESLRMAYLNTLDNLSQIYLHQERYAACIRTCQLILARDRCREDAHCMLMRCYSHQGQDQLAVRQYRACAEALRSELDVAPAPTTTQLFQQIRQHRRV